MEITIIGWYGTETIGDRAILAGLIHIFAKTYSNFNIRLGSLYPFYTQRTVCEDVDFYRIAADNADLKISIFDSLNPSQLDANIKKSNLLVVGGGPLMDLTEMNMLLYAFRIAQKHSIKSVLMGCGWGPLKKPNTIAIAKKLVELSSLTIFRDLKSSEEYNKIKNTNGKKVYNLIDPAFIACQVFLDNIKTVPTRDHISINFRDISLEADHYSSSAIPELIFSQIVSNISAQSSLPVHLIPMHNFYIGGDDREILHRIKLSLGESDVKEIQKPLSLYETMDSYYNAAYCVGMRFHSIVLQTVLNGKNFIIDYTNPVTGKTIGMMHTLGITDVYQSRYFSLYGGCEFNGFELAAAKRYQVPSECINGKKDEYVKLLKEL